MINMLNMPGFFLPNTHSPTWFFCDLLKVPEISHRFISFRSHPFPTFLQGNFPLAYKYGQIYSTTRKVYKQNYESNIPSYPSSIGYLPLCHYLYICRFIWCLHVSATRRAWFQDCSGLIFHDIPSSHTGHSNFPHGCTHMMQQLNISTWSSDSGLSMHIIFNVSV